MSISQQTNNFVSDLNHRPRGLEFTEGSTWTGQWEPCASRFNCMSIVINGSDNDYNRIGRLTIDWSRNGVDIIKTVHMRIMGDQLKKTIYSRIIAGFVRVRFAVASVQNTCTIQIGNIYSSSFEIITMFHGNEIDYDININKQLRKFQTFDFKNNVGVIFTYYSTFTDANYPMPTGTGTSIRLRNTSNNNSENGIGLREVLIIGVNNFYDEVYWRAPLTPANINGGISSNLNSNWMYVNELIFTSFGSNRRADEIVFVDINISGTWNTVMTYSRAILPPAISSGQYCIPAGQTAKISNVRTSSTYNLCNVSIGYFKKVFGSIEKEREFRQITSRLQDANVVSNFKVDSDIILNGGDSVAVYGVFPTTSATWVDVDIELS